MTGAQTQVLAFSEDFRRRVAALFPIERYPFLHRALEKGRSCEVRREIHAEKAKPLSVELMYKGLNAEPGSPAHKEACEAVERQRELEALYTLICYNDFP